MSLPPNVNVGWMRCARKRQFASRKAAKDHASGIWKSIGKHQAPYHCEFCGGWHLATKK